MGGLVLGTSQPSFEPESKARPNLLAWFSSVFITIPLKITTFLPLDYRKMIFAMFCKKIYEIFRNLYFYLVLGQYFTPFETKWPLRPNIGKSRDVPSHTPMGVKAGVAVLWRLWLGDFFYFNYFLFFVLKSRKKSNCTRTLAGNLAGNSLSSLPFSRSISQFCQSHLFFSFFLFAVRYDFEEISLGS